MFVPTKEAVTAFEKGHHLEAARLFRKTLRTRPTEPEALFYLGKIHAHKGDHQEAVRYFDQSLSYRADNPKVLFDLAKSCQKCGRSSDVEHHLLRAIEIDSKFFKAYSALASHYYQTGNNAQAHQLYLKWIALDPDNAEVRHMIAATSKDGPPERCSEAFVKTHFDKTADAFDERLVEHLGYRGHEIATAALEELKSQQGAQFDQVLDAGCGTGLCGPALRQVSQHLVGVDLSEGMMEHAKARNSYDELVTSELCSYMDQNPCRFSAIVSSDVLIYFGDLSAPFATALRALKPGGTIVTTFEALPEENPLPYRLESHGRFAHQESYIRQEIEQSGLELQLLKSEKIRVENGQDVMGFLTIAQRRYEI